MGKYEVQEHKGLMREVQSRTGAQHTKVTQMKEMQYISKVIFNSSCNKAILLSGQSSVSVKEDNAPILILSLACGEFHLHKEGKHGSKLKKKFAKLVQK